MVVDWQVMVGDRMVSNSVNSGQPLGLGLGRVRSLMISVIAWLIDRWLLIGR